MNMETRHGTQEVKSALISLFIFTNLTTRATGNSQYRKVFSYSFRLLFGNFIQLQKCMWVIKIVKTLAINLLTSINTS
ncbi:hypothetical protein E2C01_048049 [Portunus trituberculatus]|uniref:Uncharacterized protein n=1 Tax=Portunus trituberculatus TaxID=210409 RepID=A0A5B7G5B2_PORTR|nr:hypothetical protein [Portunus trituberculatus]